MDINELINLASNVGFPVVVTSYLLIRLEKQLSGLSSSICKLAAIMSAKFGVTISPNENI